MDHTTRIDNLKLHPWHSAVMVACMTVKQKLIEVEREGGTNASFYIAELERLEELEQFLEVSRTQWLDSVFNRQTAVQETK
jgi:hypothetical protein